MLKKIFIWVFILNTTICHLLYAEDVHKTYYANGIIQSEAIIISPKEAITRTYYENGNLQSENHMWHDEDMFVDSISLIDINKLKKVELKVFYEDGRLTAKTVMANGSIQLELIIVNPKETISRIYYENGQLRSETHMWYDEDMFDRYDEDIMSLLDIKNIKKAEVKMFYENGQLTAKTVMAKGKVLSADYYDEEGNVLLKLDDEMKALINDKDKMKQLMESVLGEEEFVSWDMEKITRLVKNDALAGGTLKYLAAKMKSYIEFNSGQYPTSILDLLSKKPPHLKRPYCGETIAGYSYNCTFKIDGYKFIATPLTIGTTGSTTYTMTTGGLLNPSDFKRASDHFKDWSEGQ